MLKKMFELDGDLSQAHTLLPESTTMEVLTQRNVDPAGSCPTVCMTNSTLFIVHSKDSRTQAQAR